MKTAIIGAGLAGLACALELERHGIMPDIYEKQNSIGSLVSFGGCTLRLFERTFTNPFSYLKRSYGLEVKPLSRLNRITMQSASRNTIISGRRLGYIIKRGLESDSLENQLAGKLKSPVNFDSFIKPGQLEGKYDYIVCATGDNKYAEETAGWTSNILSYVRVAKMIGSYIPGTIKMWLNTEYSKNCYSYLLPISKKEAELTLVINNASYEDMDHYWKEFLFKAEIRDTIIETRDCEQNVGYPPSVKVGNILFAGNCGGFIDDLLGIGAVYAMESGILAARAIALGADYEKLTEPLIDEINKLHEYRKAINKFTNESFDRLVAFLGAPVIKHVLYKNPFLRASQVAFTARLYNRIRS